MTTHTVPRKPRPIGRRLAALAMLALFGAAVVPSAHAQWQVNDANTQGKIDDLKQNMNDNVGVKADGDGKTLNGNLDAINKKFVIGTYNAKQPGDRVDPPKSALPADDKNATGPVSDAYCSDVPEPQQANCKKIVEIENAQYLYMVTMYNNTTKRYQTLKELLDERSNINTDDPNQFGKLQDNTNKLTALYNLLAIDQQQMQSVNYAYDANLNFLREQQAQLAKAANTGQAPKSSGSGGDGGGILGGLGISLPGGSDLNIGAAVTALTTGAVLKTTLDQKKSEAPAGMQHLSITNSW
ncbi:hypothetical protein L2Y94_15260 [Luteibacter aegosomatis]|uniref:hypothetical protein n=1 Tax=Luteibacter aegosomatis TaxID=2911537 RepID=UPI001FF857D3|nr:hypothetical protein [Luteibacter aegosomatis]UPG84673.1 hypothetical protein L2Y94_15260 [Luteibacter aegosomatis]